MKHSLPEIVEHVPAREWHLSREGEARAKRLADQLLTYQPQILVCSVEPKARETAEIIANIHKLDIQVLEGLHEHDRSNSPYLSGVEFQKSVEEFFLKPDTLVFGSETADEAYDRFSEAVHSILESVGCQIVAVVSHGTVISLFVSRLTGTSDHALWKQLGLPSLVVLDMNSRSLIAQENIP